MSASVYSLGPGSAKKCAGKCVCRPVTESARVRHLKSEVNRLKGQLSRVCSHNELLKAVLKIVSDDCQLKNGQFQQLYSDLSKNAVWQDCERASAETEEKMNVADAAALDGAKQQQCHRIDSGGDAGRDEKQHEEEEDGSAALRLGAGDDSDEMQYESKSVPAAVGQANLFVRLPKELHFCFAAYLGYADLGRCMAVCKEWSLFFGDKLVWKPQFLREWQLSAAVTPEEWRRAAAKERSWKQQFAYRMRLRKQWGEGRPTCMRLHMDGTATCLKFDSKHLFAGCDDGSLSMMRLRPAQQPAYALMQQHHKNSKAVERVTQFHGHGGPIFCLDFDKDTLVSGSYDKTVQVWSAKQAQSLCTLRGHRNWVSSVQLHEPSGVIVSGSHDSTLKVWKLRPEDRLDAIDAARVAAVHSSDQKVRAKSRYVGYAGSAALAAAVADESKRLDGEKKKKKRRETARKGDYGSASSAGTSPPVSPPLSPLMNPATAAAAVRNAAREQLAAGRRVRMREGHCVQTLRDGFDNTLFCHQWEVSENRIVSGGAAQAVQVWDVLKGRVVETLMGHTKAVYCLQAAHDKVVSGGQDHLIKVWDRATGRCELTLSGHANAVMGLQFDELYKMVSCSYDKTIKVWDLRMGQVLNSLEGHSAAVFSVQFDDDKVVSGSADRSIRIWDFAACHSGRDFQPAFRSRLDHRHGGRAGVDAEGKGGKGKAGLGLNTVRSLF